MKQLLLGLILLTPILGLVSLVLWVALRWTGRSLRRERTTPKLAVLPGGPGEGPRAGRPDPDGESSRAGADAPASGERLRAVERPDGRRPVAPRSDAQRGDARRPDGRLVTVIRPDGRRRR